MARSGCAFNLQARVPPEKASFPPREGLLHCLDRRDKELLKTKFEETRIWILIPEVARNPLGQECVRTPD